MSGINDRIKKNVIGGTLARMGKEKFGKPEKRDHWEDLGVDGRVILK